MVFKNEAQLKSFLLAKCQKAIAIAEEKVHRVIDGVLNQFYNEFDPEAYIRTNKLLHSLVKTGVIPTGNGYEAEIYFDVSMLDYELGEMPTKNGKYKGWNSWSGQEVLDVAMTSAFPHGGRELGTAIWVESTQRLGDIMNLLERELKAQGIPIKKG